MILAMANRFRDEATRRLSALAAELGDRAAPWLDMAADRSAPALQVTDGIHKGVTLTLDGTTYSIGSSAKADIVLRDEGVAPVHATLGLTGGSVRLETVGGDVGLTSGETVPEGHGCRLKLPVDLVVGEAVIRIAGASTPSGDAVMKTLTGLGRRLVRKPAVIAATLLFGVFAVSVVAQGSGPDTTGAQAAREATPGGGDVVRVASLAGLERLTALHPSRGTGPSAGSVKPASAAEVAAALRERLEAAGIAGLRVAAADGRLAVSGTLAEKRTGAWTAVQQWFDQTYGGRIVMISNVVAGEGKTMPRLALQAIWFGERPYVITRDGARYYEGAFVEDGWAIREIGAERLVLAKDDATVALTYQ